MLRRALWGEGAGDTTPSFGFGEERDREETDLHVWLQFLHPALPAGTHELVASGTTVVQRRPAVIDGDRFRIDLQIVDMPHHGSHELLGDFDLNVDQSRPTLGVVEGMVDPATRKPVIDADHPARSSIDVHFELRTRMGVVVTGDEPAHVVNDAVTELFPASPYTHQHKQALLDLFLKGQLTKPVARIAAGYHAKKKKGGKTMPTTTKGCGCPEPCCSVQAQGHCGCFEVGASPLAEQQLIFVASHPGVASSPVGRDRVFAYVTVTNEGPRAVRLFWDGLPPTYAQPTTAPAPWPQDPADQYAPLQPSNSLTLAVGRALKVQYAPDVDPAGTGDRACGRYVVSWCCPEPRVAAGTLPATADQHAPNVVATPGPTAVVGPGPTSVAGPGPTTVSGSGPTTVTGSGPTTVAGSGPVLATGSGPVTTRGGSKDYPALKPGHAVKPLIDGEEIYNTMYPDLKRATQKLFVATWEFEHDFLIQQAPSGTNLKMHEFTTKALKDNKYLHIFFLIWNCHVSGVVGKGDSKDTFDDPKDFYGNDPDLKKRFHLAWHTKYDVTGAHHQKFVLSDLSGDGSVLYCLGVNMANEYWDRIEHPNPNPYPKDAGEAGSGLIYTGSGAPHPHWHDTGIRVEGPVIKDFEAEFKRRWDDASQDSRTEPGKPGDGAVLIPGSGDTVQAASLIYPGSGYFYIGGGASPHKAWLLDAIASAKDYIWIETQYFDDDDISDALIKWYLQKEQQTGDQRSPLVALLVPHVTDPEVFFQKDMKAQVNKMRLRTATQLTIQAGGANRYTLNRPLGGWPPGGGQLARTPGKLVDSLGGIRVYRMNSASSFEWTYVHSKMIMIDDQFSIGSANTALRSFRSDSEANVVVNDAAQAGALRTKAWSPLVGGGGAAGGIAGWYGAFDTVGRGNADRLKSGGTPQGLLTEYPFD